SSARSGSSTWNRCTPRWRPRTRERRRSGRGSARGAGPAMERTAELRWFFRGQPPGPVVAWFEAAAEPPRTRSDVYLALPGTDALGVKIRGGSTRFELKLRPRPSSPLTLPGAVSGQLEEWQRWSFSRPAISRFLPRLGLPKERRGEVEKRRRLATIPYEGDGGCRVEITALRTGLE